MKKKCFLQTAFLCSVLLTSGSLYAQNKNTLFSSSQKSYNDSEVIYRNIPIQIENGHGEKKPILFTATLPKKEWGEFVKKYENNEREAFTLVAQMISLKAQYTLKNSDSFEPFTKQFFFFYNGQFASSYKLMGRNGYGNMIETTSVVTYDPNEK